MFCSLAPRRVSFEARHFDLLLPFRILAALEAGLVQKWLEQYKVKEKSKCYRSLSQLGSSANTLKHTAGAFLGLAIGLVAASLVLMLELFFKLAKKIDRHK